MKSASTLKQQQTPKHLQAENTGGKTQIIQQRAYELFLQRGQEPGHELEDWLKAEQEVCHSPERHEAD